MPTIILWTETVVHIRSLEVNLTIEDSDCISYLKKTGANGDTTTLDTLVGVNPSLIDYLMYIGVGSLSLVT